MRADDRVHNDLELLRNAAAGDAAAFEQLVDRYYSMVHTIAYGRMRHRETAEDLAQEVFLRAYLSLERIGIPSHFAGWLVRVTHNLATDWNRRGIKCSALVQMVPIEDTHLQIPDTNGKDARTMIPEREEERALHEAIFKLPEDEREVVLLHYTEGLSQRDIAERLGVHPSTVGRQLKQAVSSLRGSMEAVLAGSGPALRPPRSAALRAVALLGAASLLGSEAKASLLQAAGGAAGLAGSAAAAGAAVSSSSSPLAIGLFPILAQGWKFMLSGKGLITLATVCGLVGTVVVLSQHSGQAAAPAQPTPRVVVNAPAQAKTVAMAPAPAPAAAPSQATTRELVFPTDRSLGRLFVQDESAADDPDDYYYWTSESDTDWTYFGEAQGKVIIPTGHRVQLIVGRAGVHDLSPLRDLPAGAIHELGFGAEHLTGWDTPTIATDDSLRHVAQLKGLHSLVLSNARISAGGLAHLKTLNSLRKLATPRGVDRAALAVVCSMQWLTALYLCGENRLAADDLELLAGLPALEELDLYLGNGRSDRALAALRHLKNLRYVKIGGQLAWSNHGLAYVAGLPKMRTVNLGDTGLTDSALADLAKSRSIANLTVYNNKALTNAGLACLRDMTSLRRLSMDSTGIGDAGLAHIKELKQLESFSMLNARISDRGLAYLGQLPNLKSLTIPGQYFVVPGPGDILYTADGINALSALAKLEELGLGGNYVDDRALDGVATMTGLKKLNLFGVSITNAGFAKLGALRNLESLDVYRAIRRGQERSPQNLSIGALATLNNLPRLKSVRISEVMQDNATLNLAGLKQLESLSISLPTGQAFRDEDLACLSGLTSLKYLQLYRGGLSDAGMKYLAPLVNLERLYVGGAGVTDFGLKYLAGMTKIDQIGLQGSFTDAGLAAFDGFKNLRGLTITGANLSEPAVQALWTRLPQIENLQAGASKPPALVGMEGARKK